jgi:hypothetical protein
MEGSCHLGVPDEVDRKTGTPATPLLGRIEFLGLGFRRGKPFAA